MRTIFRIALLFAVLTSVQTANAQGPDPEDFTPEGYEFCGWKDFTNGGWVMVWREDLAGAYLVAFARGMTCTDARRNVTRVRYAQVPPYRPTRPGYTCKTLESDIEYRDVRCVRTGGKRTFRWQMGA
jgi:hypothetical protein